jgi:hypothetical protein
MCTAMRMFQIATIVNNRQMYGEMRLSMEHAGFSDAACRFTEFDNTSANHHDPFQVLHNLRADGDEPYIIFCHQDILFSQTSTMAILVDRLAALERLDPNWALAGNAGGDARGNAVLQLDDPTGQNRWPHLPCRVVSLDENFLVLRRSHYVLPTPQLSGFHLYGSDLALNALLVHRTSYVIDFLLTHRSAGVPDSPDFRLSEQRFVNAWRHQLLWGIIKTTCTVMFISTLESVERWLAAKPVQALLGRHGMTLMPFPGALPDAAQLPPVAPSAPAEVSGK